MITGVRKEDLVAQITARGHEIVSGLPTTLGGKDEGPTPHEIFEASLSACTILTVQMYAKRKGIKLESANVDVKIVKEGPESVLTREISFVGDLSEEERARLAEIAEKCPIHKLMESQIKIETVIK
ncbi:OsmC family protein [Bacteriovorax stolpii]|uniref:OsmC family protein n=1 Tax=Bacteriovorax stolpii TaxID=960 RepID=UPI001159934B|nr:OsmC family protein [Bacteriovorax stolpii]